MKKSTLNKLLPKDFDGDRVAEVAKFPDIDKLFGIAEKRTQRFALECVTNFDAITLKQALAAAYVQGISDAVKLLEKSKEEHDDGNGSDD